MIVTVPQKHKLRFARDTAGLTQKGLKNSSGVSTSTISHIECHRGPDVPRSEWRPTKTRYSTAAKLAMALTNGLAVSCEIPAGTYTPEEFVRMVNRSLIDQQDIFDALEIYEVARKLHPKSKKSVAPKRSYRHLRAVV